MFNPYSSRTSDPMDKFHPRKSTGMLSTPQKKVLIYILGLVIFAFVVITTIRSFGEEQLEETVVRKQIRREDSGAIIDDAPIGGNKRAAAAFKAGIDIEKPFKAEKN